MSIEEKIRAALLAKADDTRAGEDGWIDVERRLHEPMPSSQRPQSVSLRRRVGIALLALLIAVAGFTFIVRAFHSDPEHLTPSSTVSNGKIAFSALSDGGRRIDTINPDGTSAAALTNVPVDAFHPAWSPDGHRLLFDVQSSGGRMQIYVVNEDGTGLTQLTDGSGWNYLPAWSSDGSKIAFVSTRDGNDEIYVMNADGTAQTRLTDFSDEDLNPSWAPGGDRIAFQSNRGGNNEIYVMNADGSDVTQLTNDSGGFNGAPAWSPDGERIAFAGDLDGPGLYTMNNDGTDIVRLTHDSEFGSLHPAWSPDGASIVTTAPVNGSDKVGIFIVGVGTGVRELIPETVGPAGEVCCPSWQPVVTVGGAGSTRGPVGSVKTIDLGWDRSESSQALSSLQGFAWESGNHHSALIDQAGELTPLPFKQGPFSLASSSSATWAAGFEPGVGNYVARFQPGSAVPDLTVPIGDLSLPQVVATDAAIWVMGYEQGGDYGSLGTLIRLDPNTGEVVKKIALNSLAPAGVSPPLTLYATAGEDEALWLLIAELRHGGLGTISLVRLDASTYATTTYDPGQVSTLVSGGGAVWLPGEHGPVRLDPATGKLTPLDIPDEGAYPFAASHDAVWFLGGSATRVELFRLDLVDGEPAGVGLHLSVDRGRLWGSVDASFDGGGSVWLLYESGPLQKVQVGS